jgi:predicted AAA+ superfamily ATPase
MNHTKRKLAKNILFSLKNNPVTFLNGPRQAGKSTLVRDLANKDYPAEYLSFDNATHMAAASNSPESFLRQRQGPIIIDEVQMVPELFRVLKLVVDEQRLADKEHSNGRFLLTGSANIMALPKLSEPLVGRMSVKTLYPFAASEVFSGNVDFLGRVFAGEFAGISTKYSLNQAIGSATFPEISGKDWRLCQDWFDGYLTTILQRDVRMLAEIDKVGSLLTMLNILAARAGSLINDADIARGIGLNSVTSKSYRALLQAMFLCFDVRPWYRNIGKRLVKSSKGYLIDTLLLCHLLGYELGDLSLKRPDLYGHVVENFVATELLKQLAFSEHRASLLHFRTSDDKEVDFVLERSDGKLVAIEVKSASRVGINDFKGLNTLHEITKDDFLYGVVLYNGHDVVPFGEKLYAVPLAALWS